MSAVVLQTGSLYGWGVPHGEKPKYDDYIEFSSPFLYGDTKQITHVSCGVKHIAALNTRGELFTYGHADYGCCGHGDDRNQSSFK